MGVVILEGLRRVSTSPWLSAFGRLRPLLGRSIAANGFCLICSSRNKKPKNDFNTDIRRALVRWETCFVVLQCSRNLWITATSTLLRLLFPRERVYSRKRIISAEYASIVFSASLLSEMRWWRYNSWRAAKLGGSAMACTLAKDPSVTIRGTTIAWWKSPGYIQKAAETDCYIDFLILLNLRSFLRASACFLRFFTLGFS